MSQLSSFDSDPAPPAPTPGDGATRLRLLVTVKAAPQPAGRYDETVHAVGLSTDPDRPGWIRLYPISPHDLTDAGRFQTYDLISVDAEPALPDPRRESWRPAMRTLTRELHLKQWQRRREWLDPYVEVSMCRLERDTRERSDSRSLALVRPTDVETVVLTPHPGWTPQERRRLLAYLARVEPGPGRAQCPLDAPRLRGAYRYRCHDRACPGHEQRIGDWEFVAFQHRLAGLTGDRLRRAVENAFLDRMCGADRDIAFYVGRGFGPDREFQVLGGYWPPRR